MAMLCGVEKHPAVSGVRHPLLASHPHHAIVLAQHRGRHSGVLGKQNTFLIK